MGIRKNHRKIRLTEILIVSLLLFSSCATIKGSRFGGDFCACIVDENSQGIEDFKISLFKNGIFCGSGITSNRGFVTVQNLGSGKYQIKGEKNGYEKLEDLKVEFYSRNKCYCIVSQSRKAVYGKSEELIRKNAFEEAEKKLLKLCEEKDSVFENIRQCYLVLLQLKQQGKGCLEKELKGLRKLKNSDMDGFERFRQKLERLNENT